MKTRIERDSLGEVDVPEHMYYGAQTQRALMNFPVHSEKCSEYVIRALGMIKKAAAQANVELGLLPAALGDAISKAADEVISGALAQHFPLGIWQTGSGTQTHMNVNEVIGNRAIELLGGNLGSKTPVHPNDHVNLGQSSNDLFPTAMHIAALLAMKEQLFPALHRMDHALRAKSHEFRDVLKVGRTHLMDAVPITLGQEFSGYHAHIHGAIRQLEAAQGTLYPVAIGGTAVGTGLNAHPDFARTAVRFLCQITDLPLELSHNYFASLAGHEALLGISGALRNLAASLFKIANDVRWMGSGPRCGLQELILPQNEPGSSIMPGKVNPTQCEALIMISIQVMGLDGAVGIAGAQGNFELNVCKPLIIHNVLKEIQLLSGGIDAFEVHLLRGLVPNFSTLAKNLERSLMFVTVLSPKIGYDRAARVAMLAHQQDLSLKEACLQEGVLSSEEFDRIVDPRQMV